jgi:GTP-binding protein HflX
VGFIRDLPHGLVEAFSATLQESVDADLLLHVVDAGRENVVEQMAEVQRVLIEIGAGDVPQVLVFNKLDTLSLERQPESWVDAMEVDGVSVPRVFVSAKSGAGLDDLRDVVASRVMTHWASSPRQLEDWEQ